MTTPAKNTLFIDGKPIGEVTDFTLDRCDISSMYFNESFGTYPAVTPTKAEITYVDLEAMRELLRPPDYEVNFCGYLTVREFRKQAARIGPNDYVEAFLKAVDENGISDDVLLEVNGRGIVVMR